MHHDYGYSVCVSSQVGCDMHCAFCASGLKGAVRNLTAPEIIAQVYLFNERLRQKNEQDLQQSLQQAATQAATQKAQLTQPASANKQNKQAKPDMVSRVVVMGSG